MRRKWAIPVVAVGLVVGVAPADGPDGRPTLPTIPVPSVPDPGWTGRQTGPNWVSGQGPNQSSPLPPPRPAAEPPRPAAEPPRPATPAGTPASGPPGPLPAIAPGPVCVTPEAGGLEPHPALASPARVPVRHGTFGSPNLTLSRDYHFLDFFGIGLIGDEADAIVPGETPATDRSFVQAEYLLWWVRPANIPVLASTAEGQSFGYLGMPGTQTLLGPGTFGSTARNGFRIRGGTVLGDSGWAIDGSYFFLGEQSTTFAINSDQFPTIARPIFAPNPPINGEFGELVAFPGLSTGSLKVDTGSFLWGADVNLRSCICRTCTARSEWFVGFRHLNLRENLTITEFVTAAGPAAPDPVGTQITVQDRFATHNTFYGGQIGWAASRRAGRFDFDTRLSVALGGTNQTLDISGGQQRVRPGQPPEQFTGGLLAAGPNLGQFSRNMFSVVPEATLNVGFWLTPTVRTYVGYNYLFWSNVLRPGDQIDRTVDLTFVPNAPQFPFTVNRPQPTFKQSDVWAQGIQFGLEARW